MAGPQFGGELNCAVHLVERASVSWVLKEFTLLAKSQRGQRIDSEPFKPRKDNDVRMFLRLYPAGEADGSAECVRFYLHCRCVLKDGYSAYFSITLLNSSNVFIDGGVVGPYKLVTGAGQGWKCRTTKRQIIERLQNDILVVLVDLRIILSDYSETGTVDGSFGRDSAQTSCILDGLTPFVPSADVIVCVKGEEIFAHKFVLASRSRVLAAKLQADAETGGCHRVEINCADPQTVTLVLKFLYGGGRVPGMDEDVAFKLLRVADMLQIGDLKTYCSDFLMRNIDRNPQRTSKMLIAAHAYKATELKTKIVNYLVQNRHSFDVQLLKDTLESHPSLMYEVLSRLWKV